jgi:putative salt-induced outer membrane protein YdiY
MALAAMAFVLAHGPVAAQGPPMPAFNGEDEVYRLPPVTDEPISDFSLTPPPGTTVEVEIVPAPDAEMDKALIVDEVIEPPPKIWEASLELGLNGSTGNSEILTMRFGAHAKRCVESKTFTVDLDYSRGSNSGVISENRGFLNMRQEWHFEDSPWTPYVKGIVEYDQFRAFDVRVAANSGLGYQLIKTEFTKFITRLGAGFSQEIGGPDDDVVPEGVAGMEYEHKLSEFQKIGAATEYFPDIGDVSNFRTVSNASWEMLVDPKWNTSLKLGANHRYDSTSFGRKKNDLDYTLLVMWKY